MQNYKYLTPPIPYPHQFVSSPFISISIANKKSGVKITPLLL